MHNTNSVALTKFHGTFSFRFLSMCIYWNWLIWKFWYHLCRNLTRRYSFSLWLLFMLFFLFKFRPENKSLRYARSGEISFRAWAGSGQISPICISLEMYSSFVLIIVAVFVFLFHGNFYYYYYPKNVPLVWSKNMDPMVQMNNENGLSMLSMCAITRKLHEKCQNQYIVINKFRIEFILSNFQI